MTRKSNRVGRMVLLCCGLVSWSSVGVAQTYQDNQSIYSNQDPQIETRRSDHIRVVFGHYNRDSGMGGMTEWLAQGNLQMYEQMWNRWVNEMGLHDINSKSGAPTPKYRSNFHFLMTFNDGGGGGAYSSGDPWGYGYAMANPGYCRFDPPSGATPHENGHAWETDCGGFNGSDSSGAWWECAANWMQLQLLNTYPPPDNVIYNPMYYPCHGRDYYDTWTIWEAAKDDPRYGPAWVNNVWTNATPDQAQHEYILDRMIRCDSSGSADKAGAFKDLWNDMVKKLITWDYARQRWFADANGAEDGSNWEFVRRCRTPLVKAPGMAGWYRPIRSHWPMEYGFNLVPLTVTAGTTVTCHFQPFSDPVRQSDWRACFVAVSTNGDARYSMHWNVGTNTITLSPDETRLYLAASAVPKPMKISSQIATSTISETWQMQLTDSGLLCPYQVWLSNATPRNVSYAKPSGVTWKNFTNAVDGTVCRNIASGASVASTAYVSSNAVILDSAKIQGNAKVLDYAVVRGSAIVKDTAVVSGYALVQDTAQIYGHGKVRDWGWVYNNCTVRDNAKVIEHSWVGDNGNINLSGSAVSKGTAVDWTTSPSSEFSGCLIVDGDTANGGSGDHGVHFGWNWGADPTRFTGLADNGWQYCCLTFDNTLLSSDFYTGAFARDYHGVNHGLLMGGCRPVIGSGAGARGGYVLSLSGTNQYVELPPSVSDFSDTCIAVWVKWAGTNADQRIWSMGDGSNKVMYLTPQDSGTAKLRFVISDGTATQSIDGLSALGTTWTHVAVTFTNTTGTLYVNGAAVGTNTAMTLDPDQLNAPLMENANYLGRGNAGNYFQGSLDEFRSYMRCLSASEVLALYNTAGPAPVAPLTDTTAPTPNAATWLVSPTAIRDDTITMSATPGTDASGWVEYFFACTSGGGHDSGWVSFNKYTDCGLTPNTAYTYTVKMRDRYGNTTAASAPGNATTLLSSAGAASFAYGPVGIANGQITMQATVVTNASGKTEYKFDRSGKSSGWQASPSWTDTGLTTGGSYTYTVTVRDGRGNTSAVSTNGTAKAQDDAPPQLPIQPAHWIMQPYATISNSISMTAMDTSDPSGVQYYFRCVSGGGPDSGWQSSTTFVTPPLPDGTYVYQYLVRDTSARYNTNPTPATAYAAKITPTTGYHPAMFAQLTTMPDDNLVTFTGAVLRVNASSYTIRDLGSSATITVWPTNYGQATDLSLAFKTASVRGHLYTYTNNGGRLVSFAGLSAIGNPAYSISGVVTNSSGTPLAGITIYASTTPNASTNAAGFTATDALGRYSLPILNWTWYLCAGSSNYVTSADQVVVMNSANVTNVNFGLTNRPLVSGRVTDLQGVPIAGATVGFSFSSNATVNPGWTAITDGSGNYSQIVGNGTLYVAASASNFMVSVDRVVTAAPGASVSNANFALTPLRPRVVPRMTNLLFAVVADALPAAGTITNWPLYYTNGGSLSAMGTPAVANVGGVKWADNKADGDGFRFANYPQGSSLPIKGATIVVAARPDPAMAANAYQCVVSVFLSQFTINVDRNTLAVSLGHKGARPWDFISTGVTLAANTPVVLSYVVQPTGQLALYKNGVQAYVNNTTASYTGLTPPDWFGTDISVGKGWNGDAWSSFNGYIGDVFVYTNALSNADRQSLENDLLARFAGPGLRAITATANVPSGIVPEGTVSVLNGSNQTFTIASASGILTNVVVDGVSLGPVSSYTFTNVVASHSISAGYTPITHVITASAGTNGTISPAVSVAVLHGTAQTFTFTPNPGYVVAGVLVDGVTQGQLSSYSFTNVVADHAIAVAFVSANTYSSVVLADTPLVYYRLNETSGTTATNAATSGKAFNGTYVNVLLNATSATNLLGTAARFDGASSSIIVPALANNVANLTFEAWVESDSYSTTDANCIYMTDSWVTGNLHYQFANPGWTGGKPLGTAAFDVNGSANTAYSPAIPTNHWHHLVMACGGGSAKYYVDGVLQSTTSKTISANLTAAHLGAWGGGSRYLQGAMDEFVLYTNVLTAARIQAHYNAATVFVISASAGTGGAITPSGVVPVSYGATQNFAVAPGTGYSISNVVVDGVSKGIVSSFGFTNVTANHTITASFVRLSAPTLIISANGSGGLDITWPDNYSTQLLAAPILGSGAVWSAAGTPTHVGDRYRVTVVPTNGATFYYLTQ